MSTKTPKLLIANWKENPESLEIAEKLLNISKNFDFAILHAAPSIFAGILSKDLKYENIILQNISCFESGSHTGEISVTQAKSLGIQMSLVGHSETRLSPNNPHGDEDEQVNQKLKNLLKENMFAVLCVGEYERNENEGENWKSFLLNQLEKCLKGIEVENFNKIILAYEPVWAIGEHAKRPATDEEIVETINYIKNSPPFLKGGLVGVKILYGGSVDEKNAKEILSLENVDGLLIGRASSDPEKWEKLLNCIK